MEKKRVAQYKIIEDELRESIMMGQYKQGDMIPTEAELMIGYGVSRVTVRKALDPLVAQGMLQRVAGAGTFVKNTFVKEHVPILRGFTDEITEMGMQPTSKV
ncbi:MAG: GntR family transcriptional regulator, partial [Oscillospiraceae bacterium]|nr:GntR family transcriptional regulator [Oscillospiraceae bacterium]